MTSPSALLAALRFYADSEQYMLNPYSKYSAVELDRGDKASQAIAAFEAERDNTMINSPTLLAALRPFADAGAALDKDVAPDCPDTCTIGDALWAFAQPTVGDLRRARSAIAAFEAGQKDEPATTAVLLGALRPFAEIAEAHDVHGQEMPLSDDDAVYVEMGHLRNAARTIDAALEAGQKEGLEPPGCPTPGACSCPPVPSAEDEALIKRARQHVTADRTIGIDAMREHVAWQLADRLEALSRQPDRDAVIEEKDLYYLRSILRNLRELKGFANDLTEQTGPSVGSVTLADNIDWLDCFIDAKSRPATQPQESKG